MTNLEIIKYLATNNPIRLAELLDDIYCTAWNCGSYAASSGGEFLDECEIDDFNEWLNQDASESGRYYDHELEEWSKATNPTPTIEATYDNLTVTLPVDDPDHLWNKDIYNSKYEVIDQVIDEIKLLENVIDTTKHSDIDYVRFRKSVCAYCSDFNCMRSQVEICDCYKFKDYYDYKENN